MTNYRPTWPFALVLTVLLLGACGPTSAPPTPTGPAGPTVAPEPTATPPTGQAPAEVWEALNTALDYVATHYEQPVTAAGLTWTAERTTPPNLVGSETFQFTAGDWTATVRYPVVAPQAVIYEITLTNQASGFQWAGEVDAAGQVTEQPPPRVEDLQPLDPTLCGDLATAMADTLDAEVIASAGPFQDYISGKSGTGCQLVATGTGEQFADPATVAGELVDMLAGRGWEEDRRYQAAGPTGTGTGLRKDSGLCLLTVEWVPSEDAACPEDQPIINCELEPAQKLYTITLNCARPATGEPVTYDYQDWKSYTSAKFGYTFWYPGKCEVVGEDLDELVEIACPEEGGERWPCLSISHYDSAFYRPPAETDLYEWIVESGPSYDEIDPGEEVAGISTVRLRTNATPQAYAFDEYFFVHEGQLFRVTILHCGGREDWDLYDQFLEGIAFP